MRLNLILGLIFLASLAAAGAGAYKKGFSTCQASVKIETLAAEIVYKDRIIYVQKFQKKLESQILPADADSRAQLMRQLYEV